MTNELQKYLVVSVDCEEQSSCFDYVVATDEVEAEKWLHRARDYADDAFVITPEGLRKMANELDGLSEEAILDQMNELEAEL